MSNTFDAGNRVKWMEIEVGTDGDSSALVRYGTVIMGTDEPGVPAGKVVVRPDNHADDVNDLILDADDVSDLEWAIDPKRKSPAPVGGFTPRPPEPSTDWGDLVTGVVWCVFILVILVIAIATSNEGRETIKLLLGR